MRLSTQVFSPTGQLIDLRVDVVALKNDLGNLLYRCYFFDSTTQKEIGDLSLAKVGGNDFVLNKIQNASKKGQKGQSGQRGPEDYTNIGTAMVEFILRTFISPKGKIRLDASGSALFHYKMDFRFQKRMEEDRIEVMPEYCAYIFCEGFGELAAAYRKFEDHQKCADKEALSEAEKESLSETEAFKTLSRHIREGKFPWLLEKQKLFQECLSSHSKTRDTFSWKEVEDVFKTVPFYADTNAIFESYNNDTIKMGVQPIKEGSKFIPIRLNFMNTRYIGGMELSGENLGAQLKRFNITSDDDQKERKEISELVVGATCSISIPQIKAGKGEPKELKWQRQASSVKEKPSSVVSSSVTTKVTSAVKP